MLDDNTIKYLDNLGNLHLANDVSNLYNILGEDATALVADHTQDLTNAIDGVKTLQSMIGKLYDAYKAQSQDLRAEKDANVKLMYQLSQQGINQPATNEEKQAKETEASVKAVDSALDAIDDLDD